MQHLLNTFLLVDSFDTTKINGLTIMSIRRPKKCRLSNENTHISNCTIYNFDYMDIFSLIVGPIYIPFDNIHPNTA